MQNRAKRPTTLIVESARDLRVEHRHSSSWFWGKLWKKGAKEKRKFRIADTIFFSKEGDVAKWLFTSAKHGTILKRSTSNSSASNLEQALMRQYNTQQSSLRRPPRADEPVARVWKRNAAKDSFYGEPANLGRLREICSDGGRRLRQGFSKLQFHVLGSNGEPQIYINTYSCKLRPGWGGGGAVVVTSTERERVVMKNETLSSHNVSTQGGLKGIVLRSEQKEVELITSLDNDLNKKLDDITASLVYIIERSTIGSIVLVIKVRYAIDAAGRAVVLDANEILTSVEQRYSKPHQTNNKQTEAILPKTGLPDPEMTRD